MDGEVDMRMFSEKGQAEIAEDMKKIKVGFYDVAKDIITSDSLTILDSFSHQGDKVAMYDGVQNAIKNDKDLQKKLTDPTLTKEDKNNMLRVIASSVAKELKIELADVSTISTNKQTKDGDEIMGGYHRPSGDIALNDKNINSTGEAMNTLGHELAHSLDTQRGETRQGTTASGQSYSNEYANIMGNSLEDYAEFGMWNYTDYTLATSNTHNGLTPPKSVFDTNYDKATQNFENRVDGGEIDYMPYEDAFKMKEEAKVYGIALEVINDPIQPNKKDEYIAVPPEIAAQIKSTNPENIYIDTGVNSATGKFIAEYGVYILPGFIFRDLLQTGVKATVSKIDDVVLSTGIKADNTIQNTVIPVVKDGYYRGVNKFLEDPTKYTQGGIDAVKSYLPGVPSASKVGYGVAIGHEVYNELTKEDK